MRPLVFHGPRRHAVEDADLSSVRPDGFRVAVHAVGVGRLRLGRPRQAMKTLLQQQA